MVVSTPRPAGARELLQEVTEYLPADRIALIEEALDFAIEAHGDQKRRSGDPYITHPISVAHLVTSLRMDPPTIALCVAPFGMEEGTHADLPPQELYVVVGEPVEFRLFGSTVRRNDRSGLELERWSPGELEELSPIEITLPTEGREPGTVVAVRIEGSVTALGTLLLEAIPLQPLKPNERWKVELSVRQTSPGSA